MKYRKHGAFVLNAGQNQNDATIKLKNKKLKDRKPISQHLGLVY